MSIMPIVALAIGLVLLQAAVLSMSALEDWQ
jgi:hypothetical protein